MFAVWNKSLISPGSIPLVCDGYAVLSFWLIVDVERKQRTRLSADDKSSDAVLDYEFPEMSRASSVQQRRHYKGTLSGFFVN